MVSFNDISSFLQNQNYIILFIALFFLGPSGTIVASFLASQEYFNIWIVIFLAISAEIIRDIAYYQLGKIAYKKIILKFKLKNNFSSVFIRKIRLNLKKHGKKSLIIAKPIPGIAECTLITAGAMKMPYKIFLSIIIPASIILGLIFSALGFYLGLAIEKIFYYYNQTGKIIIALVILFIIIQIVKKAISIYSKKIL